MGTLRELAPFGKEGKTENGRLPLKVYHSPRDMVYHDGAQSAN